MKKTFQICLGLIAGIMCVGMFLCVFFPETLTGMFAENPETLKEGAKALRVISFGFVFSSVSVVCAGAMEALGKGMASLGISFLRYIGLILPMAFLLGRLFGAEGVWYSFVVAEAITAMAAAAVWKKYSKIVDVKNKF